MIGSFVLHGFLPGYPPHGGNTEIQKGRRILCSKRRKRRRGCGRTCSLLLSWFTPRLCYCMGSMWEFFLSFAHGSSLSKLSHLLQVSYKSAYRLCCRFKQAQPKIRTLLLKITSPPESKDTSVPHLQTIHHLSKVFPSPLKPLIAFQHQFQQPIFG